MRNIAIIGAGHAGLQLGIGLLRSGHSVTIVTNRTADEIRSGRIISSQSMNPEPVQAVLDEFRQVAA